MREEAKLISSALNHVINAMVSLEIAMESVIDGRDGRLCEARESISDAINKIVDLNNLINRDDKGE